MSKAEKIIEKIKSEISQLNKENKGGVLIPLKHFRIILDYIDKLQKENEELKEKLKSKEKQIKLIQEEYKKGDFIHKGFIRDKIKELEDILEEIKNFSDNVDKGTYIDRVKTKILVLKELLGE